MAAVSAAALRSRAAARRAPRVGFGCPRERLEDRLALLRPDAEPGITDHDLDAPIARRPPRVDRDRTLVGVLEGVGDEVRDDLFQLQAIGHDRRNARLGPEAEVD